MSTQLPKLLRAIRERFSTNRAMAAAIGISGSRLGRAMDGKDTLNTLNCLRLANATGERPSALLRAADKDEIATLIEGMYGDHAAAIPEADRETLAQLRALTPAKRRLVEQLLTELAAREKPGPRPRGYRPPRR